MKGEASQTHDTVIDSMRADVKSTIVEYFRSSNRAGVLPQEAPSHRV